MRRSFSGNFAALAAALLCSVPKADANLFHSDIKQKPEIFAKQYIAMLRAERSSIEQCSDEIKKGGGFFASPHCKSALNFINESPRLFKMGELRSKDRDQFVSIIETIVRDGPR